MEDEIEVPPPLNRYPFAEMQVNHSFLLVCQPEDRKVVANRVRAAFYSYCKKHDAAFTARQVEDGVRVWRVA
jgi:hypothetical protein